MVTLKANYIMLNYKQLAILSRVIPASTSHYDAKSRWQVRL